MRHIDFLTFSVAGACLVHLQYNAGHIYVGGGHAEVESLRVIRTVRVPGRGGALHLHRAVVLVECDSYVAVLPLVLELNIGHLITLRVANTYVHLAN